MLLYQIYLPRYLVGSQIIRCRIQFGHRVIGFSDIDSVAQCPRSPVLNKRASSIISDLGIRLTTVTIAEVWLHSSCDAVRYFVMIHPLLNEASQM